MGCLVSMGGLIFGYDTGQISGFLEMPDFLDRFGLTHSDGTKYFSNVRAGLIVALLSIGMFMFLLWFVVLLCVTNDRRQVHFLAPWLLLL